MHSNKQAQLFCVQTFQLLFIHLGLHLVDQHAHKQNKPLIPRSCHFRQFTCYC